MSQIIGYARVNTQEQELSLLLDWPAGHSYKGL